MTKKFDRVLSDDDVLTLAERSFSFDVEAHHKEIVWFAERLEQAVLAKLAEQATEAYPCRIVETDFETNTVTLEMQGKYTVSSGPKYLCDVPLYRCPVPNRQVNLDSSNHIADMRKMVADMYWVDPDYPSYTSILDAFDPILSAVDVKIGDQFEVGRAKTLPTLTIEVTELEENGDVKDFKVLSGDHIADAGKIVTPDGWQLVPIEPTDEMLVSGQEEWVLGKRGAMEDCEESKAIFKAMLAVAPKYRWSNE